MCEENRNADVGIQLCGATSGSVSWPGAFAAGKRRYRHSSESRNPGNPAITQDWTPAFAGAIPRPAGQAGNTFDAVVMTVFHRPQLNLGIRV